MTDQPTYDATSTKAYHVQRMAHLAIRTPESNRKPGISEELHSPRWFYGLFALSCYI